MIRVISVGMDRKMFSPGSAVAGRMIEYAKSLGELHIIVFSLDHLGLEPKKIAENVWLYPTGSTGRLNYAFDAYRIGKAIVKGVYFGQTVITASDPFETGLVGSWLKSKFNLPLQIQIHTDPWSRYFQFSNFLNWFRVTILAPIVLRKADRVRVVSEKIKRDVAIHSKVAPKNISVLPIFVDTRLYQVSPVIFDLHRKYPNWKTIILMSSRLEPEKNFPLALKAFRKIAKKYPNTGLVVVGSGSEEGKVRRLVNHYRISKNVALEGWQKELISYYKTADIFLCTSNFEGYGMSLVEAGSSGLPVVTTQVGIASDFTDGKEAFVCPVGDSKCLSNKLITLVENKSIGLTLSNEMTNYIYRHIPEKELYLKKIQDGFEELIK